MSAGDPLPVPSRLAIVVMGVSGSGKSTVGAALAKRLGVVFRDADEFHPAANVAKMSAGTPLTDADRWPWLDAIGAALAEAGRRGRGIVVGCSALKRIYRNRLRAAAGRPLVFVHLTGSHATLAERMRTRKGHFMPASLLDSQLATLEPPGPDEAAVTVSVEPPAAAVIEAAMRGIAERDTAAAVVARPSSPA
jgi:gluconokinase